MTCRKCLSFFKAVFFVSSPSWHKSMFVIDDYSRVVEVTPVISAHPWSFCCTSGLMFARVVETACSSWCVVRAHIA